MFRASRAWPLLGAPLDGKHRLLAPVILLGILSATLEGLGIGLIIPILSIIIGPQEAAPEGGLAGLFLGIGADLDPGTRLLVLCALVFGLIAVKNVVAYANGVLGGYIYGHAGHRIRLSLAERLVRVGYPFLQRADPGHLLNTLSNESWRVSDAIQTVLAMIVNLSCALIFLTFLVLLSWQMTLFVLVGLALIQTIHAVLAAGLKAPSRAQTARNNEMASRMLHVVHGGQLIRLFRQETAELDRFGATSDALRRAAFRLHARSGLVPVLTEILFAGLFLSLIVGAWLNDVGFPVIATFVVLLYRLQPYVRGLQGGWNALKGWTGSMEAVGGLLDPAGKPEAPRGAESVETIREGIRFHDVRFAYEADGAPVLNGISFRLAAGRSTALVGRSGAGKSTIIALLARLLEPTGGAILVDGRPLREIDPKCWRGRIAVASQDIDLIDGTVAQNIAYGRPDASPVEIRTAAAMAEAAGFIEALPEGFETRLGYRGANLSAGQRQRIALARALLIDPDLLILDEATNAVDSVSEAAILAMLKARRGRRMTLVVSHHRRTLSQCDDVVVLADGAVVGTMPLEAVASLGMDELYDQRAPA
ncbi:ABC transporter ATP-binding protein [Acuticoccus kandeliae]|uniref:ABC transporter ATP-binding protein n=1 Tax=Acuticoccus kandeliae TaxID=2073160 RepID=UPI001FE74F88|nr:ABC transporter ATP-binding protein [Acuticoccus kandeliae]